MEDYTIDNFREPLDYTAKMLRGGLSSFPPMAVTCAITGGNAGKEMNPNLPETVEEQVEQTYDAYKAGAAVVHIHRRDPHNPCTMTQDPEMYVEVNRKIREKCPDIIINNTAACGRVRISDTELSPQMLTSIPAKPEIASIDVTNYSTIMRLPKRPAPLFGRDEDVMLEMNYSISIKETERSLEMMAQNGIKPEFECFALRDLHYINRMEAAGYKDPFGAPHLIQFCFVPDGGWPTPDYIMTVVKHTPKNCILSALATGAMQYPVLTMAMIQGANVRVGMEDNIYLERGVKAESNAQLVEKIVRIAKELGRQIATPEQVRAMYGLGAPRSY